MRFGHDVDLPVPERLGQFCRARKPNTPTNISAFCDEPAGHDGAHRHGSSEFWANTGEPTTDDVVAQLCQLTYFVEDIRNLLAAGGDKTAPARGTAGSGGEVSGIPPSPTSPHLADRSASDSDLLYDASKALDAMTRSDRPGNTWNFDALAEALRVRSTTITWPFVQFYHPLFAEKRCRTCGHWRGQHFADIDASADTDLRCPMGSTFTPIERTTK